MCNHRVNIENMKNIQYNTSDKFTEGEGKMLALSEAQRRANDKYIKENYKQVKLSMPNEEALTLEEYCKIKKCSKAGFIRQAIKEKMEREP